MRVHNLKNGKAVFYTFDEEVTRPVYLPMSAREFAISKGHHNTAYREATRVETNQWLFENMFVWRR